VDSPERPAAKSVAGKTYPPVEFTIDRERVEDFARAIGADPSAGVPPTFAAVYALFATAGQLFSDPEAEVNFAMLVHGEQEFAWETHPEVGDKLVSEGRVVEDRTRRDMRFLTFETRTRRDAEPVLTSTMVDIIRS
jgi:hypothetical protein